MCSHAPRLAVGLLLVAMVSGCKIVQATLDLPGHAFRAITRTTKHQGGAADPVLLQQRLLRFADEFSTHLIVAVENLRRATNAPAPAEILRWKIEFNTDITSIVSGPNAIANLLDMTIFVTVTRLSFEEHWQPKVFGEAGLPMLESCRKAETEIWRLAATVLKPKQQAELRNSIEAWHKQNPTPESVREARAVGFSTKIAESIPIETELKGVFSMLTVDPFASIDPAVREAVRSRMFAERTLYVMQKMPILLRWQTELMGLELVEIPTVQRVITSSAQIISSVERFAAVAQKLPEQISVERKEIFKALGSQENFTPLVQELRQTFMAGSQLSMSLNTLLKTYDAMINSRSNSQPFRIQDYTEALEQLESTAHRLTELFTTLDEVIGSTNLTRLSAHAGSLVEQTRSSKQRVLNSAFWRGVLLIFVVLLAALIYRFLSTRLGRANRSKTTSP